MNLIGIFIVFGSFTVVSSITLDKQTWESIKDTIKYIQRQVQSYFQEIKQSCLFANVDSTEVPKLLEKFKQDNIFGLYGTFDFEFKEHLSAAYDERSTGLFGNLTTAFSDLKVKLVNMTKSPGDCPIVSVLPVLNMLNIDYSTGMRKIFCTLELCGPSPKCEENECAGTKDKRPFVF